MPSCALFPGTRRNLLKYFKILPNCKSEEIEIRCQPGSSSLPGEQFYQRDAALFCSHPFHRHPVFKSALCPCPASISPWSPFLGIWTVSGAAPQRTTLSVARLVGNAPGPPPPGPMCPHMSSVVLQTSQPRRLSRIFNAQELLQGGDIFSQQLQTGQQSFINMGESQAALLAALGVSTPASAVSLWS